MIANILTVAGSDPSGGAGIQADLKTFAARGTYGMAALTALTAQNTRGVIGVQLVPSAFVADQIKAVFADVRVDAIKIGMIGTAEIAEAVADALTQHRDVPIVLDPVMVAKGGASLLARDAVEALTRRLLPLATLVTPNLPEAAALLGEPEAANREVMARHAERLLTLGPRAVLVKGGHLSDPDSPDVLVQDGVLTWLEGRRSKTVNTHGTGCTLSSAIAAELGKGLELREAVRVAKDYVSAAIARSDELTVGSGHGPVHHLYNRW